MYRTWYFIHVSVLNFLLSCATAENYEYLQKRARSQKLNKKESLPSPYLSSSLFSPPLLPFTSSPLPSLPLRSRTPPPNTAIGSGGALKLLDPVVDLWSRWSRSKICQVESIEKSSTTRPSRSSRVDFSTSRIDRLADD